jgi:hypothetical protein
MNIGLPKEVKAQQNRVSMIPVACLWKLQLIRADVPGAYSCTAT